MSPTLTSSSWPTLSLRAKLGVLLGFGRLPPSLLAEDTWPYSGVLTNQVLHIHCVQRVIIMFNSHYPVESLLCSGPCSKHPASSSPQFSPCRDSSWV